MTRHPTAGLHREFPQGEIGAFLRGDQHLNGGVLPRGYIFLFHSISMFERHCVFPFSKSPESILPSLFSGQSLFQV
jgi:hypothetical protein